MLTLRALAMEKVFTQDLSPDSCPKTLLKEMQTLKKARNIVLKQYSCRSKRRLLRMLWTNLIIESDNITVMDRRRTRYLACLLYTSPSPRDQRGSRMPSSA